MPFKPGGEKIGGRKKGTPNKSSIPLAEKTIVLDVNPFEILLLFAKGDWESLGYQSATKVLYSKSGDPYEMDIITPDHRLKAASEAAQYLYPKLKAISGEIELKKESHLNQKSEKVSFERFCENAGYPKPFLKQMEMRDFAFKETCIRLILGSRGYGKTDYVTVIGVAYEIYLDLTDTNFIITKSKTRNTAIINEIANALEKNGVELEKRNSTEVRVKGLIGKDSSASAATIKSVSMRGRHPRRIIMDDPVTPEDKTESTRAAAKAAYNEAVKLTSNVLLIGQPVHKFDLFEEIRPIVKKIEIPYGSIPELDPDLEAQRLAGVDEASIQASYFLKVLNESTTPFNSVKYLDKFPEGGGAVAVIDPSEGGDFTAISIIKAYMQGVSVVGFAYKRAWNHCLDDMAEKLTQYGVQRLCFETNKHGNQPLDILRQVFPGVGVVGRYSNNNKHARIMTAGTYAHMIHLSKESDKIYLDQVVKYEYKAKYDDCPDSLAICLEWLGLIRGKR